ncbi:NUDIX hydrolase [Prosthecomicrobium sp. N25]|uniref:NUDIX hydrolase n=1 Tax=Prosthecomicrobium sp. N25 TaxID=3129254 RepID=UPI003076AAA4
MTGGGIEIGLNAAIVAVEGDDPLVLATGRDGSEGDALPFGPFDPIRHRTLEIGLRSWVSAQTTLTIGYVEQLYTFGDRGRLARAGDSGPHVVSVGYLALTRPTPAAAPALAASGAAFRPWYGYFPWEDWRGGRPALIDAVILPALRAWAAAGPDPGSARSRPPLDATHLTETEVREIHSGTGALGRRERLRLFFGDGGSPWDEEKVLERYELLYEAALVEEALRDGRQPVGPVAAPLGLTMRFDHRRILATAISRLRAKLKYRPVVFELMPEAFTLTDLQRTVEAISGRHLHKQNFRRLVEQGALVEPTGETSNETGGRPAQLFRFRRDVLQERPAPGLRLGTRG